jgi:hypothetical protein
MPRRNRVTPTGDIAALLQRGLLTGNRGILHDTTGQMTAARWRHPHWISCTLTWKGIRRPIMAPGTWTELFFLDEAVALAAGHRPCALCRRAAYTRFCAAWTTAYGTTPKAAEVDRILHAARLDGRAQRRHTADIATLPEGAFILTDTAPVLVRRTTLHPFGPTGYGPPEPRPGGGSVIVLTPAPIVAVLRAGYGPTLHPDTVSPP